MAAATWTAAAVPHPAQDARGGGGRAAASLPAAGLLPLSRKKDESGRPALPPQLPFSHCELYLRLRHHARQAAKLEQALASELVTLERSHFRNQNQHRAAPHWKKLASCRKHLKRLVGDVTLRPGRFAAGGHAGGLRIGQLLKELLQPFAVENAEGDAQQLVAVPTKAVMAHAANRTAAACLLMSECLLSLETSYCMFKVPVSQSYFIPVSLLFMACLSRARSIICSWRTDMAMCFDLLRSWLQFFPVSEAPDCRV
ncbi:MAG: hypothetical protein BJ554DRAFT_2122 [Olpidium bornovanus]|uniref:Nucleolus and neural progenitor protein-like N-terminal domain-containing protein n=1 Tax=Olpidium bornovanus TaxID=278681 RepID=A0A8H7ZR04_9FUNG|nr:MAG: hypothetical protein BJ554DRAFT_2122 [Olpidium bornovanus]